MRSKVSRCRCGSDWRDAPGVKASPEALKASRRISELCADGDSAGGRDKEPLGYLGLRGFCEALSVIADHYLRMKEEKRVTSDTDNSECHEAFSHAFSALEGWPRRFEKFLNEYGLGNVGGSPEFRPILELHKLCKAGDLSFITVALEEFIEEASSRHGEVLSGARAFSKRFITLRNLGRYFNTSPVYLKALIRCGRIHVFRKEEGVTDGILIDVDSAAKFKEKLDASLTSADVAHLLGVAVTDVDDLVRHSCLLPVSGASVDGLPEWRFDHDEPDRLLGEIGARIVAGTERGQRERVSCEEVLRGSVRHKISAGCFVRNVLDGNPTPRSMGRARGLSMFAFSKKEIAEFVFAKTGEKIGANEKDAPTFRQLASTLEKMKERNDCIYQREASRREESGNWVLASGRELARIALLVFSKATDSVISSKTTSAR